MTRPNVSQLLAGFVRWPARLLSIWAARRGGKTDAPNDFSSICPTFGSPTDRAGKRPLRAARSNRSRRAFDRGKRAPNSVGCAKPGDFRISEALRFAKPTALGSTKHFVSPNRPLSDQRSTSFRQTGPLSDRPSASLRHIDRYRIGEPPRFAEPAGFGSTNLLVSPNRLPFDQRSASLRQTERSRINEPRRSDNSTALGSRTASCL